MLNSIETQNTPLPLRPADQTALDALSRLFWQIADAVFLGARTASHPSIDDPCFMADPLAHPHLQAMDERMLGDLPFDGWRIRERP